MLRSENKINPGIFDEKRGITALLIKNSGVYFVHHPERVLGRYESDTDNDPCRFS